MRSVTGNITESKDEAVILLDDIERGLTLRIVPKSEGTLHRLADPTQAETEPEWQLYEGCFYDFELSDPNFTLSDAGGYGIVRSHLTKKHVGQISTNIYTGTIEIAVLSHPVDKPVGKVHLEIQSLKTGYREDYRSMLEFITEKCTDLVMQSSAPTTHFFEPDYGPEEEKQRALYQRFAFIKSVIDTEDFAEAIHRVVTHPVTRWSHTQEPVDIRRMRRFSRNNLREITNVGNRSEVPDSHYLKTRAGLQSVPVRITSSRKTDSFDTSENRFVKHALETFLQYCTSIHKHAGSATGLQAEAKAVMVRLESHLHHSLFREISRAESLPLNSPVLQRKEGYREILRTWLMFDLAAKLVWKGGDHVYGGRKKDVATLYEYWLFFHLLDVFVSVFDIPPKSFDELVEISSRGLDIKLRKGRHIPLRGVYRNPARNLNIRFSYSRSFQGYTDFMNSERVSGSGSWTADMYPDYTLSMWPESITEDQAESNELIVHIHFDAKYKVKNLLGLLPAENAFNGAKIVRFEADGINWDQICKALTSAGHASQAESDSVFLENLYWLDDDTKLDLFSEEQNMLIIEEIKNQLRNIQKNEERKEYYKNADLLKMHAYKDAIRRTGGAYVLYPGAKSLERRGFHEIIPGLGAFAVNPSKEAGGTDELRAFIVEVRDLFISRISQREKMAIHTKRVHEKESSDDVKLAAAVPEFIDKSKLLNPDETWVLVGYYQTPEQLAWIQQTGQYNFRADAKRRGALPMNAKTAGARYLLLHGKSEKKSSLLFKLNGGGPHIMLRSQLEEDGYPHDPQAAGQVYYVYNALVLATDVEFEGIIVDVTRLSGYKGGRQSSHPFTVSLTELMAAVVDKDC